ncbi:MAG: glycosyltransferase, partial [Nocardioidaceae bacterium]
MSKVLLVGKGAPDRGGIPTFLQTLRTSELAALHDITFLNVAHSGTPEGGKVSAGNIRRTLQDAWRVFRQGRSHDIVHIHSALAPAVTVARGGLLVLAGRLAGCAVIMHAHGGNIETWLTTPLRRRLMRWAMAPAKLVVAVWSTGEQALADTLGPDRVRLIDNGVPEPNLPRAVETYDPPRVLYVGLLTPRKGVLDL